MMSESAPEQELVEVNDALLATLEENAQKATKGPWLVFDMDNAEKMKHEPLNEPGQGWYWVWAEHRLPYYGGVMEPERHSALCTGSPETCCKKAIGSAAIHDAEGGMQEFADATYIASASPDVVMALVARIRELEGQA